MGKPVRPRFGSMGVWPRKRAKRPYARVRSVPKVKEAKPLAFAGYKAGMTHVMAVGSDKNKRTAKTETAIPVTIIECPPMRIASIRLYKKTILGSSVSKQLNFKFEKELSRKMTTPKDDKLSKAKDVEKLNVDEYSDVTIQVYTQPKATGLKKKPEIFEVALGGTTKEKIEFVKNHMDKPILISEVFKEGQVIDLHAVTKGKGFQGPVKRFGIGLKSHKSEKGVRAVGSLGGWSGQGHVMYRIAHAGQMGYHQRTQYNNIILKIGDKPEEVNAKGGFINFGLVKSTYVLIRGTIPGAKKRLITMAEPIRSKFYKPEFAANSIKHIMTESKQGR